VSGSLNHDSPREIREILEGRSIALKKRWGQNFLINPGARQRLITELDPRAGENVWEIGPGLGAMTGALLEKGCSVTAFEIDRGLCAHLQDGFGAEAGFALVQGDFLKTWKTVTRAPDRILGNLPYRSASLMIASLIEGGAAPRLMVFTVQKELAERMTARPGSKAYSSFSVLCQAALSVTSRGDLQPGSFYPAPEVVSTVLALRPAGGAGGVEPAMLSLVTRSLFRARRKTLRNNASGSELARRFPLQTVLSVLRDLGIDPERRAEELEPAAFIALTRRLAGTSGQDSWATGASAP
jgi:16S rRNA (adenine1518-N6/adenine1519-N6)-dimethyltransferase